MSIILKSFSIYKIDDNLVYLYRGFELVSQNKYIIVSSNLYDDSNSISIKEQIISARENHIKSLYYMNFEIEELSATTLVLKGAGLLVYDGYDGGYLKFEKE